MIVNKNEKQSKKYHAVGTVPKFNRKTFQNEAKNDTANTYTP